MKKHWWKWICEFCYRKSNRKILPEGWDWVWQSAVCPACRARVAQDGGYHVVKGGAYANGKPDPRSQESEMVNRKSKDAAPR